MATDDAAIKDLTREVERLSRTLGEVQARARAGADAVGSIGDKARVSVAGMREAAGALTGVHGGIDRAVEALGQWIAQIPEGASRAEAHQRALAQLGGAYEAVRSATNGAVSAEQAAQVQQRALQSGVRLTAQELAAVTARARDYARATGTELGQALDQLTDQLVDPGEELRKFGVFLQTGMSAGDALRETLRQLGAQASSTQPAVLSLAEAQEQLHRAAQDASDALSASVAQKLELRDFYTSLAEWINTTTGRAGALTTVYGALVDRLREAIGLEATHARGDNALNQSRSGAWMQQAGTLAAAARNAGVDLGGVDLGALATRGTDAQRAAALDALRRAAGIQVRPAARVGAGVSRNREFDVDVEGDAETRNAQIRAEADRARRTVAADLARIAREAQEEFSTREASRTLQAEIDAWAAQEERDRELRRRNTASTSAGSQSDRRTRLQRLMDEALGGGASDWVHHNRSLRSDLPFEGSSSEWRPGIPGEQDPETMLSLLRQGQEKAKRAGFLSLEERVGDVDLRRRGAEASGDTNRVRILSEQRDALRALADEATREEQAARAQGRTHAEVNDLMRQRIGIQMSLAETTRELTEATREQTAYLDPWIDAMRGAGDTLAGGFADALFDAVDGTKAFVDSMDELLRATLRTIAKQAVVEALKSTATGLYNLATGNVPGSIAAFKAAAVWGGTAVAAGVASAAAPPTSGAQGAARVDGGERSTAARADRDRGAGGPLVLNVTVSGAAFTDAGVHQAVASALRGATSSGYLTPTDLRGLLNG